MLSKHAYNELGLHLCAKRQLCISKFQFQNFNWIASGDWNTMSSVLSTEKQVALTFYHYQYIHSNVIEIARRDEGRQLSNVYLPKRSQSFINNKPQVFVDNVLNGFQLNQKQQI